ncbi:ADP-ribosylation factor family protein [Ancylostoma duodenale]|uniref:ADP-ribosylation factor-like protein 6 n=1 Tax=Ancylostoma duodenale TaxID=51022 RepID=A0A0C2C1S2_9BILA|nr:ADP-ribosylation factor family protein [Ancylostoma duodenale]
MMPARERFGILFFFSSCSKCHANCDLFVTDHKIIIVGLDNAGKTTILYNWVTGDVVDTKPTIGSNVEEVNYRNLRLVMWDIGGQESLRNSWSSYYTHTNVMVVVIDSTDAARLPLIKQLLYEMLAHEDLAKASLLVLANKQDKPNARSAADISSDLGLLTLKTRKWQIHGCSAIKGEGLNTALDWIANNIT